MKKKYATIKGLLLGIIFICLCLPLFQDILNLYKEAPLKGAITQKLNPEFNINNWLTGDYQEKKETFLNESFGFRKLIYRFHNQINYFLFKKSSANGVIIGNNNFLFEMDYISAYYGDDYIGDSSMSKRIEMLKFVSDTLEKINKKLVLVFAPGKASFFPEHIPKKYRTESKITNFTSFIEKCRTNNINFVDFKSYFIDQKEKSDYSLFPKYGVHWSYYASCIAADSMISYFEAIMKIDMPDIFWNNVKKQKAHGTDIDLLKGMNLLFDFRLDTLGYPDIVFEDDSGKVLPSVLVISDSFFWQMYDFGIKNVFSECHFWYFNREIYPESFYTKKETIYTNLMDEFNKHDIIVLMASEARLYDFGWGFIERANDLFKGVKVERQYSTEFMDKVNTLKQYIKSDKEWMSAIKAKAAAQGISVETVLTGDAIWTIENEEKNN